MQNTLNPFACFVVAIAVFSPLHSFAVSKDREESIRNARVWQKPGWITEDFKFTKALDMRAGPPVEARDQALKESEVSCMMTEKTASKEGGGMTPKFYCELLDAESKSPLNTTLKVKYDFRGGEISGEVLGTRLLWALGFAADRMFLIETLNCHGCTENPHADRRVDSESLEGGRFFDLVGIERKLDGKEIVVGKKTKEVQEGWTYHELMSLLPEKPELKRQQEIEREALRLLSVFLRHADNKAENQSLICLGKADPQGGCGGETVLMIHDLGVTFGKGYVGPGHMSKTVYEDWRDSKIWADSSKCIGELGENFEDDMVEPVIREEGRVFLAKLLRGFSSGAEGRKRVEDFFMSARADYRMGTLKQWTDTFLKKVEEIEFPMGRKNPGFSCPTKFNRG